MCPQLCYVTAAVGLTLTITSSYLMCLKVLNKSTPYLLTSSHGQPASQPSKPAVRRRWEALATLGTAPSRPARARGPPTTRRPSSRVARCGSAPVHSRRGQPGRSERKLAVRIPRRQNQAIGHRVSWRGVRRVRCARGVSGVRCERCVRGVRDVTLLRGRSGSRWGCERRLWLLLPCRS